MWSLHFECSTNERSMSFSSLKAGTIIETFTLTVGTLDQKEVNYIVSLSNTDACWLMRRRSAIWRGRVEQLD
jgi:hypothetical protein